MSLLIKTFIKVLCLSLLLLQPMLAMPADSDINPYHATYKAKYNGIDVTATHQLVRKENGVYLESSEAKSVLGKISESSQFIISDQGDLKSQRYSYRRSLFGVTRTETKDFDWSNGQIIYTKNSGSKKLRLETNVLDMLTHKLQIRRDLRTGTLASSYPVISRDRIRDYVYEIIGQEILETSIGPIRTTKIRRVVNSNKNRETIIWLADEWDFLTVKLVHLEKGERHQLDIIKGRVGGKIIIPLKRIVETPL